MKITPELRKAINAGVRRVCAGANPLAEVGYRPNDEGHACANGLNWCEGNDLWDLSRLASVTEIDDHPAIPGAATLDLYVTSGTGSNRELETNVYITIKDGKLADLHTRDLESDARCRAILGVDFSKE